jgi:hypothetical protein
MRNRIRRDGSRKWVRLGRKTNRRRNRKDMEKLIRIVMCYLYAFKIHEISLYRT